MTVTALMFDMCCVWLHCHAEGSHLKTDVQVSNSLTQMSVYQSECSHCLLCLMHEFNMAEPHCITEYRLTQSEFFGCGRSSVFQCVPSFLLGD